MSDTDDKKSYRWVPPDFLKGVFIKPYNFEFPESPDHANYVNEQMKFDLFYDAFDKVSFKREINNKNRSKRSKDVTLRKIMSFSS